MGEEEFLAGLRAYFQKHAWGNTELSDLLVELEQTSGATSPSGPSSGCARPGSTLLRPEVESCDRRHLRLGRRSSRSRPACRRGWSPSCATTGCGSASTTSCDGRLTRTGQVELDVVGARTEVPALAGRRAADLLLVNDDDLTYAKIRLDARSSATAIAHLGDLDDPMPRALVWGAAWDMTRDAEWSAGDYLTMVLSGRASETDVGVDPEGDPPGPHRDRPLRRTREHGRQYSERLAAGWSPRCSRRHPAATSSSPTRAP